MQACSDSSCCRSPSTQSDTNLFPNSQAQEQDAAATLNANPEQASMMQAAAAASTNPDRTAKRPGAEDQATAQQSIQSTEEAPAATAAAAAQVNDNSWRSALRAAVSGLLPSSLHSASGDAADSDPQKGAPAWKRSGKNRSKRKTPQAQVVPKSFPWNTDMVEKTICFDTCHKAVSHYLPDCSVQTKLAGLLLFQHQLAAGFCPKKVLLHSAVSVSAYTDFIIYI